jgi:uncharacterized protein YkwD
MRITRSIGSLLPVIALLGSFLVSPLPANAMTVPMLLEHDGLIIDQSLTVTGTSQTDLTASLSFGKQQEIAVTAPAQQEVLAEAIVVPTVEEESPQIQQKVLHQTIKPTNKVQKTPTGTTPTVAISSTTTSQPKAETTTPTPSAAPQPTAVQQLQLSNGGLNADKLFSMSNSYRQSKGLSQLQKDDRACQVAASRAPEIAAEIAGGHMHSGIRARNLPYWNSEIIITMRTEEEAFNWWINDTIHREAIEGNYTYSCTACSGNACVQEFTNFQAK